MTDAPDLDHLEALRAAAAIEGRLSARTTGRAGGDHWYLCDDNESVAHITANDGEDEELRQPRAEYITALHNADLVAALREAEAKLAAINSHIEYLDAEDHHGGCRNIPDAYSPEYYQGLELGLGPIRSIIRKEGSRHDADND